MSDSAQILAALNNLRDEISAMRGEVAGQRGDLTNLRDEVTRLRVDAMARLDSKEHGA
jgi:hypothetical protein